MEEGEGGRVRADDRFPALATLKFGGGGGGGDGEAGKGERGRGRR